MSRLNLFKEHTHRSTSYHSREVGLFEVEVRKMYKIITWVFGDFGILHNAICVFYFPQVLTTNSNIEFDNV